LQLSPRSVLSLHPRSDVFLPPTYAATISPVCKASKMPPFHPCRRRCPKPPPKLRSRAPLPWPPSPRVQWELPSPFSFLTPVSNTPVLGYPYSRTRLNLGFPYLNSSSFATPPQSPSFQIIAPPKGNCATRSSRGFYFKESFLPRLYPFPLPLLAPQVAASLLPGPDPALDDPLQMLTVFPTPYVVGGGLRMDAQPHPLAFVE